MTKELIYDFLKILFTFVMLLDPIGNTPAFLAVAGGYERKTQLRILKHAIAIAGVVLLIFALGGRFILIFFGITPGAFYIAGGIIFFKIALEMINSKPRSRHAPQSTLDPAETRIIAVFPLAFPLIAGPGMITTIMVYTASPEFSLRVFIYVLIAIVIGLFIEYMFMRSATKLMKFLGRTGMFVMEKIVGLILAGLSVQLVYDGLVKLEILKAIGIV